MPESSVTSAPFFAWCEYQEPFDISVHMRRDVEGDIYVSHGEGGFRSARVSMLAVSAGAPDPTRRWCHISVLINGELKHLFHGEIVKSPISRRRGKVVMEFHARLVGGDDDRQTAAILAPIYAAGGQGRSQIYVPETGEASSPTDADTLLKASSRTLEYDKDGIVHLVSIFGDPNLLRTLGPSDYSVEDQSEDTDIIPSSGTLTILTLSWTERRYITEDIGPQIALAWSAVTASDERYLQLMGENGLDAGPAENRDEAIQRLLDSGGEDRFTFTPKAIEDSLPKRDDTLGSSFYVLNSGVFLTDGPGTNPRTESRHPEVDVMIPIDKSTGRPLDASKRDSSRGMQMAKLESTGFSDWYLQIAGVAARERREVWSIYTPSGLQDVVAGNNPPTIINIDASDLTEDRLTDEWKSETDYLFGDRVQSSGMTWQCVLGHTSTSSLFADIIEDRLFATNYGQRQWIPINENQSAMGRTNVDRSIDTAFGRRVVGYAIRRGIAHQAWQSRIQKETISTTVDRAFDLDPRWTLRIDGDEWNGGGIEGKIVDIEFAFEGGSGNARANITIAASCGSGDPRDQTAPIDGAGTGEDGSGEEYLEHGIDPPDPLIDPTTFDWAAAPANSVNFYDVDWDKAYTDPPPDPDYYADESEGKLYFDYDRDGIDDLDDPDPGFSFDDGGSEDEDLPAASEGGLWDQVRYRLPIYGVEPMQTSSLAKVRIQWTGIEQQLALKYPAGRDFDGIDREGESVRGLTFVGGQSSDDFLEKEARTRIDLIFPDSSGIEPGEVKRISLTSTPWQGPRQVSLSEDIV